ncbi:acetyl-CoA hydrolase/transferase C-terminal domain-containing protein [Roseovarius pelagicus]|uniref:Acetyl-CoA hydrolase/transferase C-terminal domain-containing protein n=1 Tax=Roseovarius pelagicus TaxID=2980108 RepID=A0ABY6DF36_9RHOB|nr:acetyl-CoA hydrolase/transferase C-terminal domain-containing protein [Roseovarius pelagicus]UXX84762.1 hypothetical protein N7U68_09040 [Roseovarius pelagicus]
MATTDGRLSDAGTLARQIIDHTGGDIRLALPLGLGKANTIVNALTDEALRDSGIRLTIFTALTLQRPISNSDMQARFLGPAADRLFGAYTPLHYATCLRDGTLPDNITVLEFFFQAGVWLGHGDAQQNYVTANYTHALHYLMARRPNVIAQLIAQDHDRFSLGGNTDITVDLLKARRDGTQDFLFAGEINPELPFMGETGEIPRAEIDLLLDDPETHFELFSVPKRPVALHDHAIGLHVSRLIRDGGTLQIGIGAIGDAVASALMLRHQKPAVLSSIWDRATFPVSERFRETASFETGLYAVTEMLVQGILELMNAGVVKRNVDGVMIHAGFFLDCRDFYRSLRDMPEAQRARIRMMPVSFTNQLYGDEQSKRAARVDARFVNAAMKVTALGGVVSDITENGQIVSGVGGQFNFVDQAFALKDARSVITLQSTRTTGGRATSNIVWDHPHETIPRHMRDIVVTEYGIADLRGRTDAEAILAMIAIADSRFQPVLLQQAKAAGKLPDDAVVPAGHDNNTPAALHGWLHRFAEDGALQTFPFGTDFTEIEQRLLPALALLKQSQGSVRRMAGLMWHGMSTHHHDPEEDACLDRMRLSKVTTPAQWLASILLRGAIRESGPGSTGQK